MSFLLLPHLVSAFIGAGGVHQAKHQDQSIPVQLAERFDAGLRETLINFFRWRSLEDIAEDLAQEVYLRVWKKWEQGIVIKKLGSYALGVAYKVAAEESRKRSRSKAFSHLSDEETVRVNRMQDLRLDPALPLEQREEEEKLRLREASFQELPPEDKELLLRYVSFSSNHMREELAAELGLSVNALRVQVYRIRQRLQRSLERKLKRAKLGL